MEAQYISKYHRHHSADNQCSSSLSTLIRAPVHLGLLEVERIDIVDLSPIGMSEQPEFGQRQQEPVCKFVKALTRNKNFRKRTHDEDGDEDEDKTVESAVISKRKQHKDKGLNFLTGASNWYSEADNEEDVKQPKSRGHGEDRDGTRESTW